MGKRSVLVIGPPLAGKSTWVREQAKKGDLVYDFDLVHSAISLRESHQHDETLKPYVFAARDAIFEKLTEPDGVANAWIISTSPKRSRVQEQIDLLDAQVKTLLITQEEAHRRADDAERPQVWHDYIDNWFRKNDWTPDDFRERLFDADAQRARQIWGSLMGRGRTMGKRDLIERRFMAVDVARLELRADAAAEAPELQGYGVVFNTWAEIRDWWGVAWLEQWAPGATAKTIAEGDIRSLFNHDPNIVLGRNRAGTLDLVEDATGLRTTIRPPASSWGASVTEAVRRGDVSGMSVMFAVVRDEWERPAKKGDSVKRTIKEVKLFDVGPVTFPAFEATSIQARAQLAAAPDADDRLIAAVRLAIQAQAGLAPTDDERAEIGTAVRFLERWTKRGDAPGAELAHPSPMATPGAELAHLAAERARLLALIKATLG